MQPRRTILSSPLRRRTASSRRYRARSAPRRTERVRSLREERSGCFRWRVARSASPKRLAIRPISRLNRARTASLLASDAISSASRRMSVTRILPRSTPRFPGSALSNSAPIMAVAAAASRADRWICQIAATAPISRRMPTAARLDRRFQGAREASTNSFSSGVTRASWLSTYDLAGPISRSRSRYPLSSPLLCHAVARFCQSWSSRSSQALFRARTGFTRRS